jgi:hypothetical protein
MTEPQWEDIVPPRGAFFSWGPTPGAQSVTGLVLDYSANAGTDFNGDSCPQLSVELRIPTYSLATKTGVRTDHAAGELVILNCGAVSLKRSIVAASLKPGDLVKIDFARLVNIPGGNTVKEFDVKVARGQGGQPTNRPAPAPQSNYRQGNPAPQSNYQQSQPPQAAQAAPAADPWASSQQANPWPPQAQPANVAQGPWTGQQEATPPF